MEKKAPRITPAAMLEELKSFSLKLHNHYNDGRKALGDIMHESNTSYTQKLLGMDISWNTRIDNISKKIDDMGAKFVVCQDAWNKNFDLCKKERALELEEKKKQVAITLDGLDASVKALNAIPSLFARILFMQKVLVVIGLVGAFLLSILIYQLLTMI